VAAKEFGGAQNSTVTNRTYRARRGDQFAEPMATAVESSSDSDELRQALHFVVVEADAEVAAEEPAARRQRGDAHDAHQQAARWDVAGGVHFQHQDRSLLEPAPEDQAHAVSRDVAD